MGLGSFLGNEVAKANNSDTGVDHQLRNIALRQNNITQSEIIGSQQQQISTLNNQVDDLQRRLANTEKESQKNKDDVRNYENLLSKPMYEIAQKHLGFRRAYEEQQKMIANWMVSQKAFKELAIQFGLEKGMAPDEVIQKGFDMEIDVLENKNNPDHNTNTDNEFFEPYREELKKEFHASRK